MRPKFTDIEKAAIVRYNNTFGTAYNLTYAHFKVAKPDSEYNKILAWANLPIRVPPSDQNISRSLADAKSSGAHKPAMSAAGGSSRKPTGLLASPGKGGGAAAGGAGIPGGIPFIPPANVPISIFSINEGAFTIIVGRIIEVNAACNGPQLPTFHTCDVLSTYHLHSIPVMFYHLAMQDKMMAMEGRLEGRLQGIEARITAKVTLHYIPISLLHFSYINIFCIHLTFFSMLLQIQTKVIEPPIDLEKDDPEEPAKPTRAMEAKAPAAKLASAEVEVGAT